MTDTRNAHVAGPFRSTLNEFLDAPLRTPAAPPRPIKAAFELMLTKLAAMTSDVPRLSIDPAPKEFEDINDHICEVARAFDQWLQAVGREVKANAKCNVDLSSFTDAALTSVEGFATAECTRAAEAVREERAA